MLEHEKLINPLYNVLNVGNNKPNFKLLLNEAENYCKKYNKDLRVYILGIKLAENQKKPNEYLKNLFNYINLIENFNNIWSKFTIELLSNKNFGVIKYANGFNGIEKNIQDIISLLEQYGDNISKSAAKSAWSAWSAWSARSAAWSARSARSAAKSAWSARSAAESAESAARSAAWSARSAAESAESAAWSARSAESTESAAWSAAWSAAYKNIGDCYLNILNERVKNEENKIPKN